MQQRDLFEFLKETTGAPYISFLRYPPFREDAINASLAQEEGMFPLCAWNDWISYVTYGTAEPLGLVHEVKCALRRCLSDGEEDAHA